MSQNTGFGRIPSLDGLRAISICLVLVGHLTGSRFFFLGSSLAPLGDLGELGVRVFFIISGFLITSLLMKEERATGTISLRMFYFRRTMRIFPAFYTFLAVMAVLAALRVITLRSGDMWHAVTYTTNYHYDRAWWLGHLWSLSVEEQFYLLWPAVMVLASTRRAMTGAAAVVLLCPVIRFAAVTVYPGRHGWMGESFPTIADALATGCLLAGYREQLISQRWYKGLLQSRFFLFLPALAFLANRYPPGRIHAGFIEPLVNICIAVTIDRFVRSPGTLTGRFLNLHPISYLGGLSYSLYLWQQPFLRHQDSWAPCPINLLCALAMAWLSYRLVETPFLALRKRWELSMNERRLPPLDSAPDLAAG